MPLPPPLGVWQDWHLAVWVLTVDWHWQRLHHVATCCAGGWTQAMMSSFAGPASRKNQIPPRSSTSSASISAFFHRKNVRSARPGPTAAACHCSAVAPRGMNEASAPFTLSPLVGFLAFSLFSAVFDASQGTGTTDAPKGASLSQIGGCSSPSL